MISAVICELLLQACFGLLQEAQLPLWLRPYEVLVTSNRTALIELIPDSLSIHTIKAKSPPGASLRDHFIARHGQVLRRLLCSLACNVPVCICISYLSASVLSTCVYLHRLPVCICTVHLSVPALPTCLCLHCQLVGTCTVYLSVSQAAANAIALAMSGLPAITMAVMFSQTSHQRHQTADFFRTFWSLIQHKQ